ncbi:MAG: DUF1549 domain-containing protein [Planctomycetes bacterium]|nr:DUF1549 domain-containing protein [Planctomycetota bacterium]
MPRCIPYLVAALLPFATSASGDEPLTFERHIRPILKAHCLDCHGANAELEGELDLRLRRFMVRGGESGPAIKPGDSDASYLLERIRSHEMPPGDKKVSSDELATLEKWIAAGAITARDEPEELDSGLAITPEEREFWSFQPLTRPAVPDTPGSDRVRTPIDAFILAELQKKGIGFSPDADDLTLLQRAYFDLTGLPPSPADVAAYLANESPTKYETLLDELLASPRYGERWARHWLDVAGYADTEGYTTADADRPWAYRYRDYVIKAINADKPFDEFLQEQLAGDELVAPPYKNLNEQQIDKLTATGFLRMAGDGTGSGANDDDARNHTISDTVKIVSTSLLGLSVGCAQCHDHRYDPIPHTDYYQLRSIFEPALDWKKWRTPPQRLISLYTDEQRTTANEIEAEVKKVIDEKNVQQKKYIEEELVKELAKYEEALRKNLRTAYDTPGDKRTEEQKQLLKENPSVNISGGTLYQYNKASADALKEFDKKIAEIRAKKPVQKFIRALTETPGQVPVSHLFYRGEYKQPKQTVTPASLTISAPPGKRFEIPDNNEKLPSTGRRLAFARWLFSGTHPLVGRVLANRVWMHHFGRGIVGTPSDFGLLGQKPTHPKLLDWLAVEFAENGWSLKSLHRRIMLSTVYRQSSKSDPAKFAVDGANLLYWKKPVVRLSAEALYDRILATSGVLEHQLYGPPAAITTDDTGQTIVSADSKRRGVYVKVKRTQPVALLKSFDAPVMEVNCESRPSSTVATQSLMLMNSEFILRQAKSFAERISKDAANVELPAVEFDLARFADPTDAWKYGYGRFDAEQQRVISFTPLPHWTGSQWQGGKERSDPTLGWVALNATGGHPGGDSNRAAIRRWTAPFAGKVSIHGHLKHPSESGDGVEARVVSSRLGVVGHWQAQHSEQETSVAEIEVEAGDVLDLHLGCRSNENSDSFHWTVTIDLHTADAPTTTWSTAADFHGPQDQQTPLPKQVVQAWHLAYGRPPTADEYLIALKFLAEQIPILSATRSKAKDINPRQQAMTNLCQVLLSSNEFLYVD